MVILLSCDVPQDGGEMLLREADYAKSSLLLDGPGPELLVHFVGAGAFDLSDELAERGEGFELEHRVDMSLGPADTFEVNAPYLLFAQYSWMKAWRAGSMPGVLKGRSLRQCQFKCRNISLKVWPEPVVVMLKPFEKPR
jgi:hypothetical protein